MPESRAPLQLQGVSLAELQSLIDERRLPPVERWNPERCGHSGMRIARDGTWYHDGAPIRRPEMVRQTGVTPVNEAQAKRHAEQAIRAVQLAAPFKLPDEYYNAWKVVGPFGFDWKLSQ